MKKYILSFICALFFILSYSLLEAMEEKKRQERQWMFLSELFENAQKTHQLSGYFPQSSENKEALRSLAAERKRNNISIIEYNSEKRVFLQETKRYSFLGYWLSKNVNTFEFVYGIHNLKANLFACKKVIGVVEDSPEDEDQSLLEALAKTEEGWNVYIKTKSVYCLKAKFLFSIPFIIGFGALWHYHCPTCFSSLWSR